MSAENLFDIVFKGRFVKEIEKSKAISHFAKLFKLPAEKAELFFDGSSRVLKKSQELDKANNFRQALKKAGLKVSLVKKTNENYKQVLTMSAVGVTLIPPVEIPIIDIPTPQFCLDEVGVKFVQPKTIEAVNIDVSLLTINEEDTKIIQKEKIPKPVFDLTNMSLDEIGAIFDNPKEIVKPEFDLSNLTLDDVGSTIVEKKIVPKSEIKIDGIQLID